MTARERFHETMRFGSPDRVPYWEIIGHWPQALERWQQEGMPGDVHVGLFFGFDRRERLPVDLGLAPAFKAETLDEDEQYRYRRDGNGVVSKVLKEDQQSIPQYHSFPVSDRASWEQFKQRLNPTSPCRYHPYWEDYERSIARRDYPVAIHAGSIYGWLRNWMGMENISMAVHDDPAFVEGMMADMADFICETIRPALEQIPDIDYAVMWEDMCFKSGPLLSPAHFRKWMAPQYRKITGLLREHGVTTIIVDCDGNHDQLNALWLEGGLSGVYPLEVAAGEDPVALRKEYGKDLHLCGGIDKRVLAQDTKAIDEELEKKVPFLIESGGWIPSIDHAVPPDVPFGNYMHYLARLKEMAERG